MPNAQFLHEHFVRVSQMEDTVKFDLRNQRPHTYTLTLETRDLTNTSITYYALHQNLRSMLIERT